MLNTCRIAGIISESIVDGPGIRYVIFMQGCLHNCKGCHNPETHDLNGGFIKEIEQIKKEITDNPLLDGITISGGEPFLQPKEALLLALFAKEKKLNVMVYTGFTYEQIVKDPIKKELLDNIDYLVDGPFILEEKSLLLNFKGSRNQRIIDINKTKQQEKIILADFDKIL